MTETKQVICKKCGFCFCFPNKFDVPDVDCFIPSYCEKLLKSHTNTNVEEKNNIDEKQTLTCPTLGA